MKKHGFLQQSLMFLCIPVILTGCATNRSNAVREDAFRRGHNLRYKAVPWRELHVFEFICPDEIERFRIVDGEWEIRNGRLCAVGGDRNRAILIARCFDAPLRIEITVTNYAEGGLTGDITVLLNALPGKNYFSTGYALTTGSYWNTCSSFYKKGTVIANTSWSPLVPGRKNLVIAEFNNGHIRYEINGKRILEVWDESPLDMSGDAWIGIRTWSTLMCIEKIIIYRGEE